MRIKEIAKENRPRERLKNHGVKALSDAELIAIMLQSGTKTENVIDISNRLISRYGTRKLANLSLREMQEINGIGPAKAMKLKAALELGNRAGARSEGSKMDNPKTVFEYASHWFVHEDREQFITIALDKKNRTLSHELVSIGTLDAAIVHPREVFKSAIKEGAGSIIVVHNHPSGDPSPSSEDLEVTRRLADAGKLLGIDVLDHVIVGKERWWSWRESNSSG